LKTRIILSPPPPLLSKTKKKKRKTEIIYLFVFHAANPGAMVYMDVSRG
jgi:hypothetical protein